MAFFSRYFQLNYLQSAVSALNDSDINFPTLKIDANAAEVYNAKSVLCCGFQCLKFVNALALD